MKKTFFLLLLSVPAYNFTFANKHTGKKIKNITTSPYEEKSTIQNAQGSVSVQQVIVIAGPSCSGKSTLAKSLQAHLGANWEFIGYDEIEDSKGRNTDSAIILNELVENVNNHLKQNKSVIVDTNVFEESYFKQIKIPKINRISIYAPLQVLLERDAIRTHKLNRNEHRAKWAREYVIESYKQFYPNEKPSENENIIDTNQLSKEKALITALEIVNKINDDNQSDKK